jgi:uncharacterized protein (TIGR02265 family)
MSGDAVRRYVVVPDEVLTGVVDERRRIASVPDDPTTKGMYFQHLLGRLPAPKVPLVLARLRKPPASGTYQPFLDYPFADALVLLHAVAAHEWPSLSPLEGLRRLGRDTVSVFLQSAPGKVVATMRTDLRGALMRMPQMWKATDPKSAAHSTEHADGVKLTLAGFHGWLDCGVIGTLEQVVMNYGARPTLIVEEFSPTRANIDVRWTL